MTLTRELTPDEEDRLARAARAEGLDSAAMARKLLTRQLLEAPADGVMSAAEQVLALLRRWQAEDHTRTIAGPRPVETPTQAIFRRLAEEDAEMTDGEREPEERLWDEMLTNLIESS